MSFISKALSSVHLGGISNLWRGLGIQGLIRASASKKSQKVLKYMAAAGTALYGGEAMAGGSLFSGGGAAAGSAGSAGSAGAGSAGSSAGLTEFGTGVGQDASLTALNGAGGATAAGGSTGATAAQPSWMKYARMANSVSSSGGGQQQQDAAPKMSAIQAPASDAQAPQKKSFIGTALTALQTAKPQAMGGADAPTALQ